MGVPREFDTLKDEEDEDQEQMRRNRRANRRGYRDLILATKDMLVAIVGNAKSEELPKGIYMWHGRNLRRGRNL